MFWIASAFVAYSLFVTWLYFRADDRATTVLADRNTAVDDHRRAVARLHRQSDYIARLEADNDAVRRAYSRLAAQLAGHPSAVGLDPGLVDAIRATGRDDAPVHGIGRPALKIVEGL